MPICPQCGTDVVETARFCRRCGAPQPLLDRESAPTQVMTDTRPSTSPALHHTTTPAYLQPANPPSAAIAQAAVTAATASKEVAVGKWLSEGWQIFSRTPGAFIGASVWLFLFTILSGSILTGPMLSGMYSMALRAMRGERPRSGDVFNGMRSFGKSFLAWLLLVAVTISGSLIASNDTLLTVVHYALAPLLCMFSAFTFPLLGDRHLDLGDAIGRAVKMILSQRLPMLWLAGLVFTVVALSGMFGCGVGMLVTFPFAVCAGAVAFRDLFPNVPASAETSRSLQ